MTGCATFQAGAPKGAVNVIAHRGASAYAPENTLAAFNLACDMGADWFELDVTLTRDGEVVVIHDDTLERTTNAKGHVGERTLAELKKLDAGSWKDARYKDERLPTLHEALDLAKKRRVGVYIEIKNADNDTALIAKIVQLAGDSATLTAGQRRAAMDLVEQSETKNLVLTRKILALIHEHHMERQVVVQSFAPIACLIALAEAPKARVEQLALKDKDNPERWPLFLRWTELTRPAGFNSNPDCVDKDLIDANHRAGRSVAVWTIDEEADMRRFAEWGADALITNCPDKCLAVLKGMHRR